MHHQDCSSIGQVIGDKPTDNQKYSEVFNTCEEVKQYIKEQGYVPFKDCGHCNPNCCEN